MQPNIIKRFSAILSCVFLIVVSFGASSGSIYGPESFPQAENSKNEEFIRSFSVSDPSLEYELWVTINDAGGIKSFSVEANSTLVISEKLKRYSTGKTFQKPINLNADNELVLTIKWDKNYNKSTQDNLTVLIIRKDNEPPLITALLAPEPSASGWNNSDVVVSFECTDQISDIKSCTSPVTISTEGSNQSVTGYAEDLAGNQAETTVTVNIDKTNPVTSISSPENGIEVNTDSIDVAGSVSDNFGIAGVTVNGIAAEITGSNYSASVPVAIGDNTITTVATDLADNSYTASISVTRNGDTAAPVISSINPSSATIGELVTIAGSNFLGTDGRLPKVQLTEQGEGLVSAPVSSATDSEIIVTVPPSAATGPVTVAVADKSVVSATDLNINASSDFVLSVEPANISVLPGKSAIFAVSISSTNSFAQLAQLNVEGLPSGLTASFSPQAISVGQTGTLTISAPAGQAAATSTINLSASAQVDGIEVSQEAQLEVTVEPLSTSFLGRTVVADPLQTPLAGVTVTMLGVDGNGNPTGCTGETVSDIAGNFSLTNLAEACVGGQLIRYDGSTTTKPEGEYAGVDLFYDILPDVVTESPVLVHLPRIDNAETWMVIQNHTEDQVFYSETIPNLSTIIYAGTTLTMKDGSTPNPFPLTAIEVPVDRLPEEMPPNDLGINSFIVAFQPANATASQPVAVFFPNRINTAPLTPVTLMTLDPTQGVMVNYGTGTVSEDGTFIIPDFDPAFPGHRYGLVHFDWHGQRDRPNDENPDSKCNGPSCQPDPCDNAGTTVGNPIDISSGLVIENDTDISFGGGRGVVRLTRTYRTLSNAAGPFGIGTNHNYGYRLDTNLPNSSQVINVISPDGNQIPFVKQLDGTLINGTSPSTAGAVMTVADNGNTTLKWKNCVRQNFVPSTFGLGSVLTSVTDQNGNTISLTRNAAQPVQITEIIDPVGRKLKLEYDSNNRITKLTDPIGRTVTYSYNTIGRLATVTNPEGGVTRYQYNAAGQLSTITDPRGIVVDNNVYGYLHGDNQCNGHFDEVSDLPYSGSTCGEVFLASLDQRVVRQTLANGGVIRFDYKIMNPLLPASPVLTTVVTDPEGHQTRYRYNPQGLLLDITDHSGQTVVYEREAGTNQVVAIRGTAECEVCQNTQGGDIEISRDDNGNVTSVTDALGNTTTSTYDLEFNKPLSIIDALGGITQFTYDAHGNLLTVTDPNGNTTTNTYNNFGLLSQSTDALGNVTNFEYDGLGNLVKVTDALGNATAVRYDAVGRPVEFIDSLGNKSKTVYDKLNRIVEVVDAQGKSSRFSYDAIGNLLSVTDAKGNVTRFTYNEMGLTASRIDPLGKAETYRYDLAQNLTEYIDRRGVASSFIYDELNRIINLSYSDGVTVDLTYDPRGRVLVIDDSEGGIQTFSYDVLGRQLESNGPTGTVTYSYDALGRTTTRQVVGQDTLNYSYDAFSNLISAQMPSASVEFAYDALHRRTTQERSNGVVTNYNYDSLSRITAILDVKDGVDLNAQNYTYDALGNRLSQDLTNPQSLITAASVREYDSANRLLSLDDQSYSYDENGNRSAVNGIDGLTTYEWDSRNRLRKITTAQGVVTSFDYDALGNLIQRQVTGSENDLTERFVLDDITNVAYRFTDNGEQQSVLSGQRIDAHLAVISGQENSFIHTDTINSTIATTNSNGEFVNQFTYEPFGQNTSPSETFPFQYTGRQIAGNNLYYYRSRFYDPIAGRFVSEDSIGFESGDINIFRYASNNPLSLIDPIGENPLIAVWVTLAIYPELVVIGTSVIGAILTYNNGAYTGTPNGYDIAIQSCKILHDVTKKETREYYNSKEFKQKKIRERIESEIRRKQFNEYLRRVRVRHPK